MELRKANTGSAIVALLMAGSPRLKKGDMRITPTDLNVEGYCPPDTIKDNTTKQNVNNYLK